MWRITMLKYWQWPRKGVSMRANCVSTFATLHSDSSHEWSSAKIFLTLFSPWPGSRGGWGWKTLEKYFGMSTFVTRHSKSFNITLACKHEWSPANTSLPLKMFLKWPPGLWKHLQYGDIKRRKELTVYCPSVFWCCRQEACLPGYMNLWICVTSA